MMLVVPPARPAAVPVKKSSAVTVPMKGSCMWVCGSIPPGMTYWPLASMTWPPLGACRFSPTATILSPSHQHIGVKFAVGVDDGTAAYQNGHLFLLMFGKNAVTDWRVRRLWWQSFQACASSSTPIHDAGQAQTDEPGVGVDGFEDFCNIRERGRESRVQKARNIRQHADHKGDQSPPCSSHCRSCTCHRRRYSWATSSSVLRIK